MAASSHWRNRDEHVVGQLLGIALMNQCSALNVAKTLVGTSADLRDLVRRLKPTQRRVTQPRFDHLF